MGRIRIDRRTTLKGLGASIALPYLEIMAEDEKHKKKKDPPRMAWLYIPGCVLRPAWFPKDTGSNYTLPQTWKHIERHRDNFTLVSGTMHIEGQVGGHGHKLNWLTAHNVRQNMNETNNSVSVDQVAARHFGNTYLPSLVLSYATGGGDHGVTLSRNEQGADIPPTADPKRVFAQLFPPEDRSQLKAAKARIALRKSILDAAVHEIKSFQSQLGAVDKHRVDSYLTTVREVEQRVQRRNEVLDRPRPSIDKTKLKFEGDLAISKGKGSYQEFLELMSDLIVLGFQTDMTRVATFALSDEVGPYGQEFTEWKKMFPKAKWNDAHQMHHGGGGINDLASPNAKFLAMREKIYANLLGRMLDKLKDTPGIDGSVLDHSQIVLGGAQDKTHRAVNFPMCVAGGKKLGWKHGQHVKYPKRKVPCSNLYLTMLQQAGCRVERFKESTGNLSEVLA